MSRRNAGKRNILALLTAAALLLSACGSRTEAPAASPTPTAAPAPAAEAGTTVRISELMAKNKAVLRDEDGDFSDWIELENYGTADVELTGWRLSDRAGREGFVFPAFVLPAGYRVLVWASGKDRPIYLHTGFSLSAGETVSLYDAGGTLRSAADCLSDEADVSVALSEESRDYECCLYPSPGYPNSMYGYRLWQETLAAEGPLVINEAVVFSCDRTDVWPAGPCDWVELKNISDRPVELSGYRLSDKPSDLGLCPLPEGTLEPGAAAVFLCSTEPQDVTTERLPLNLNSAHEQLYLSDREGRLLDYAFLRDIPCGRSYGRLEGENGFFYLENPSPGQDNGAGYRFVSRPPVCLRGDGVFSGTKAVSVELQSEGAVYYSLDEMVPPLEAERYDEPFEVRETCVIRCVAVEEGGLPSRPLHLSCILNEDHSLPVLSLVTESASDFAAMYSDGEKGRELSGSLSFYEEGGGFSLPCGVRMHGQTSLNLPKKNLSVHFRAPYGQEQLSYDIYGGGVTEFSSLVLRSGQDYYRGLVLNALAQNMALRCSDALISERSRFCVLYLNGSYAGIYTLMEKPNEALYASLRGVSRDSVTVINSQAGADSDVYRELFDFCASHDLSDPENYEELSRRLDLDSLIDWIILQGWSANEDLTYGNLRYCRSTEDDGRWRLMYYDLDASFGRSYNCFRTVLKLPGMRTRQVGSKLIAPLLESEAFRDRLLRRAGELLRGPLADEAVLAELDRLAALVEPEVERDYAQQGLQKAKWDYDLRTLRSLFSTGEWHKACVDALCEIFFLTPEQRTDYFGA